MSCGSEYYTSNCVCDTLLAIVEAQEKVSPSSGCTDSCATAIQELLNGVVNGTADTIPVILYCKGTCAPFEGLGVARTGVVGTPFAPVSGYIFRVVEVDPETCCAVLEILEDGTPLGGTPLSGLATATALVRTEVCITVDLNCFCGVSCLFPQDLL
ncbi:CotY/CotZ family spore coat protein [Mesobacillus stamsii]|uniref:Spore coat protein Z n=1 Tax=Mesobacillus stamsii TaxID=225347 RepID=A0ABU0FVJ9_9BACI|nr:CotY/CotZ family spore coat protein [Mesobacillus stamsii]MDQ0413591.1 spore coat protein Z [Mesobacillus stamsii]